MENHGEDRGSLFQCLTRSKLSGSDSEARLPARRRRPDLFNRSNASRSRDLEKAGQSNHKSTELI